MGNTNVAVIVVTYNRLNKLKKALEAYEKQCYLPKYIIIVNNASSDGTTEFLNTWKEEKSSFKKVVLNLSENLGGSGGFYEGQKYVLGLDDVQWVMIADDDAYPEPNYLCGLVEYINENRNENLSVVCGKVLENGKYVNVHRRFLKTKWQRIFYYSVPQDYFYKDSFELDFVSYVGVLINITKLLEVGLVEKDFFIWNDDVEHSCRLKKVGKLICLPKYEIIHDAEASNFEFSWKDYYGFRNNICIFKRHFKLQMPLVVLISVLKAFLCPIKGKSFIESKLRLTAIKDGFLGNLGKHPVYKPGWKP